MDAATHLTWLRREGELLAATPADALELPVPACPGWTIERLIGHVGRVHAWAGSFLRLGPDGGEPDAGGRPPKGEAILGWYAERLHDLLDEMGRHDPGEPSRSFAGLAPAGFWWRRQAHEVAIHRVGAQQAIDAGSVASFEPAQAADGVDEWLEVFAPRFLALGEGTPTRLVGTSLHLHATEPQSELRGLGEWTLRLTVEGCDVERGHAKGDAALRGPAGTLFLRVWHRDPALVASEPLDTYGDPAHVDAVLGLIRVV